MDREGIKSKINFLEIALKTETDFVKAGLIKDQLSDLYSKINKLQENGDCLGT